MELASSKHVFSFPWCVSLFLLFPVLLATHVTSSSILIDNRHIDDNGEIQEIHNFENGNDIGRVNDVTGDSRGDKFTTNTASEKFLESLQQKCKKYKSITLICNSLRLVLPIIQPNEPISASEEINNRDSPGDNITLKKRLTPPLDVTDTDTDIARPDTYEATIDIPMTNRYVEKGSSVATNRENEYDPNWPYALDHMLPNMDGNTYQKPGIFHSVAYQNHMMTDTFEDNVFRKSHNSDAYSHVTESDIEGRYGSEKPDITHNVTYEIKFVTDNGLRKGVRREEAAYGEIMESGVQYEKNDKEPDKPSNIAYQNHMTTADYEDDVFRKMDRSHAMTGDTEDDVFRKKDRSHAMTGDTEDDVYRKMDRLEQNAYSDQMEANDFTTPYTDMDPDFDEMKDLAKDIVHETEDEDTRSYLNENKYEMACSDEVTCSVDKSSTVNVSDKAEIEGGVGKIDNTLYRFIEHSAKIFKNSFTIKFPTFERITNKMSEWLQFVFGRTSRDEGKILHCRAAQ
jgi:hypothetical protein